MIRIQGRSEPLPSSPAVSLLNLLQRGGVPIHTICGGRAQCGRCLFRVLSGQQNLSPLREAERHRLKALKVDRNMRLACQSYARGDIEIQVINPGKADPAG
jgi:ferredoxin